MLKKYLCFFAALTFCTSTFAAIKTKITQTEVINFQPITSQTHEKQGVCWTNSIALTRPDAWRCSVNNEIYDPCFTTKNPNILICGADPIENSKSFPLKLKEALPKPDKKQAKENNAWIIELSNGALCNPYTGTMPILNDRDKPIALQYGCNNLENNKLSGLLDGSVKPGKIWHTKQVIYTMQKHKVKTLKIQDVKIKKIWR
jgi:hypothetical protein